MRYNLDNYNKIKEAMYAKTDINIFNETKRKEYKSSDKCELSFGVISDIHLRAGKDDIGNPYYDFQAENKFKAALQDLYDINNKLDALIINGDLTITGMQTDYDSMNKILKEVCHPEKILFSIGNHEYYSAFRTKDGFYNPHGFPNGETEQTCIDRFLKNTGMPNIYYDKWIKGYHFIILGSEKSRISNCNFNDNAVLSDGQLQWLEEKLKGSVSDKPIFIFLHQPIPYTVAGSDGDYIINYKKLLNILKKYQQIIFFSGHSHYTLKNQPMTMYKDRFIMFNSSTVINPLYPNGQAVGNSEGLYIEVYKNKVEVTGRDFINKSWIDKYTVPLSNMT